MAHGTEALCMYCNRTCTINTQGQIVGMPGTEARAGDVEADGADVEAGAGNVDACVAEVAAEASATRVDLL
jgi:hypothetical protein